MNQDGDSLTFDHDSFDFGDWESEVIPFNDIEDLEVVILQIQGEAEQMRLSINGERLMINEAINNSSNRGLFIESLSLAGNVSYDYSGSSDFAFLSMDEMYLNDYEFSSNESVSVLQDVFGGGDFTISSGQLLLSDISNYDGGEIILKDEASLLLNPVGAEATDQISISGSNESYVAFCGDTELEFAGNITIGGEGRFSIGAISFDQACGGRGGIGAREEPPQMSLTLSGLVELTADTKVRVAQNRTMVIENIEKNGFSIDPTEGSSGKLVVEGEEFANEPKTIIIEEGDDQPDLSVTVLAQDTMILNGSRDYVSVFGTLKGIGSASWIGINGGATLAPGLSPGCMQTDRLDFASTGTYEVEIGGTEACDEYDQMQVSESTSLGDAILDVSFIDDFTPSVGDEFVIILSEDSATINGTFDNLEEGAEFTVGDVTFSITYEGGEDENDVILTVVDAPEADEAPDAPDTGFALIMSNPFMSLIVAVASASGLAYFARRHLQTT